MCNHMKASLWWGDHGLVSLQVFLCTHVLAKRKLGDAFMIANPSSIIKEYNINACEKKKSWKGEQLLQGNAFFLADSVPTLCVC